MYPETAQFGGYPQLYQEWVKLRSSNLVGTLKGSIRTNPIKILKKREPGHIQRLPKFFGVSPIISGRGKATNFKFCMCIHSIHRKEKRVKNFGESSRGHTHRLPTIFRALIYRVHRVIIFAIARFLVNSI